RRASPTSKKRSILCRCQPPWRCIGPCRRSPILGPGRGASDCACASCAASGASAAAGGVCAAAGRARPSTRARPPRVLVSALCAFMASPPCPLSRAFRQRGRRGPRVGSTLLLILTSDPGGALTPREDGRGPGSGGDGGGDLAGDQAGVKSAPAQEILVAPLLDDPPLVEHHDLVGRPHRGQAVRDHHGG